MSPDADVALWVGLSIGLLLLGVAVGILWRVRTGPHPLNDYPSDEAYYAAKSQAAAGTPASAAGAPAATPVSPPAAP